MIFMRQVALNNAPLSLRNGSPKFGEEPMFIFFYSVPIKLL